MAEEFEGGVCGGNWPWNSARNLFRSSPCSLAANEINGFGWPSHDLIMDMKVTRSSDDSAGSAASDGSGSVVLHDVQNKPQQMMGINTISSSTADDHWNRDLLHDSGKSEDNYSNIPQIHNNNKDWSFRNFGSEDSTINNSFKQMNQNYHLEPLMNSLSSTSTECAASTGQSCGFPLNMASYSSYTSSLLQTLFDVDSQPQQPLMDIQAMNYSSAGDYNQVNNSNEIILPSMNMVNPSFTKQHEPSNQSLPFTNTEPLWNASTEALSKFSASFLPSTNSQFLPSSPNNKRAKVPSFVAKHQNGEAAKKAINEPAFKRARIETPSPLPTFKVRKEKLGDRVTALQQLVSPFGKTDTASVLHEAIEYIKFLHDQVSALSTPYLKYTSPPVQQHPQAGDKVNKDQEGLKQDLKSRGLCLVPISSTFPVAAETTSDFWTPTFAGSFK